jgi:hypothetical protein
VWRKHHNENKQKKILSSPRESKRIFAPPISNLKGCTIINEGEEDINGKL